MVVNAIFGRGCSMHLIRSSDEASSLLVAWRLRQVLSATRRRDLPWRENYDVAGRINSIDDSQQRSAPNDWKQSLHQIGWLNFGCTQ